MTVHTFMFIHTHIYIYIHSLSDTHTHTHTNAKVVSFKEYIYMCVCVENCINQYNAFLLLTLMVMVKLFLLENNIPPSHL